jgi:response regulator RpfG family c-di-GMP phosphodiesterase
MAVRDGAYDYIRKPCNLEEINVVVKNAIEKIKLNRENRELLKKLQEAYHELMALKERKLQDEEIASMRLFSPNLLSLHHLFDLNSPPNKYIDKLQALSSLREGGLLTEEEFKVFKKHLLDMITPKT